MLKTEKHSVILIRSSNDKIKAHIEALVSVLQFGLRVKVVKKNSARNTYCRVKSANTMEIGRRVWGMKK